MSFYDKILLENQYFRSELLGVFWFLGSFSVPFCQTSQVTLQLWQMFRSFEEYTEASGISSLRPKGGKAYF